MQFRALCLLSLMALPLRIQAAGLTQHQYMAERGISWVSTPELEVNLAAHTNDWLMGAPFPDTGWIVFNFDLSDVAHSQAFINEFVEHLREKYAPPYAGKERTLAFLLGVASHVADDPPYHAGLIPAVAEHDFHGNTDLAHTFCDGGLDFTTLIDLDQWDALPKVWLPLGDILSVYQRLGYDYPASDFILGNVLLVIGEHAERYLAEGLYGPLERIMPWALENYITYANGGLEDSSHDVANYYEDVWADLMAPVATRSGASGSVSSVVADFPEPLRDFAWAVLDDGTVGYGTRYDRDGSVTLSLKVNDPVSYAQHLFMLRDTYLELLP